jgi:general secretion pathway protein D
MVRIIRRIDQAGDEEIDVIPLEHASAAEVVRVVNVLYPQAQAAEGGIGVKLVADERTNSVLVSGEKSQRLRLKTLVTHLDTPLESGGDTQVRYLRFADAEKLAAKLKEQASITVAIQQGAAPGAAPAAAPSAQQSDRNITIWAEPETNALVVTAPPKVMRALMAVVDKLDIRRAQIHVEAILVEVSGDKTADLGVNWLVDGSQDNFAVGGFIQPIAGASIVDIVRGIDDPSTLTSAPTGFTAGGGRISDTGTDFAVLLRALRADTNTNIIATPSVVTMDNQEAEIKIAQEVPFITGSFTQTGTDATNPFQTIQREEVGNILKITPQISEGQTVILKIEQEASSLAPTPVGSVDLVTNKRTITTNVLVDDGGIIVLGGLIRDELLDSEQRVPFLGAIPLIGELFKVRNTQKRKTNFMVFIRPKILRDGIQTAIETNTKYNMLRELQLKLHNGKAPLLPFEKGPALPPADATPPGVSPATPQTAPEGAAEPAPPVIDVRPATRPPPAESNPVPDSQPPE